jgi:hypothetical protein
VKYVYLIQVEGSDVCKVGFTKHKPEKRLKELQTASAKKLVLADYYKTSRASKIESTIHNTYSSYQLLEEDGKKLIGEWFRFDYETRKNFKKICKKIDDNFKAIEEMSTLKK